MEQMIEFPVTGGSVLIDADDLDAVRSLVPWRIMQTKQGKRYAVRRLWLGTGLNRPLVYMHRFLMDAPAGKQVDHINGNGLDNRRANMRLCSGRENARNRIGTARSGYKGVYQSRHGNRWYASIRAEDRTHRLGAFETPEAAARAYDEAAVRFHGDFARLNFPKAA